MSIKKKSIIVLALCLAGFFVIGGLCMNLLFFHFIDIQEKNDILRQSRALETYLDEKADSLLSRLMDWAKWDDTYHYIESPGNGYVESNLNVETVANLDVTFLAYHTKDGKPLNLVYYDAKTKRFTEAPAGLREAVAQRLFATPPEAVHAGVKQFLCVGENLYVFTLTTITDSIYNREPNGYMAMGLLIDGDMLDSMGKATNSVVSLLPVSGTDGADARRLVARPPAFGNTRVLPINRSARSMQTLVLPEIPGQDADIVFSMASNREILTTWLWFMLLINLVFLLLSAGMIQITARALDRFITRPFVELLHSIAGIRPDTENAALDVQGSREMVELGRSINGMLDAIRNGNAEIRQSEAQFSSLVNEMKQGVSVHEIILDEAGRPVDYRFLYVNESYRKITGLEGGELIGRTARELRLSASLARVDLFHAVVETGQSAEFEGVTTFGDRCVHVVAYRPRPGQFALILTDTTERKRVENEREYASLHDQLTGLYNRRYVDGIVQRLLSPEALPLSVIMGDMNGLKFLNDAFGHDAGDRLLAETADVLRKSCRAGDIIARWGGDEFLILLPNTPLHAAGLVCERIRGGMSRIVLHSMNYTMSLGYDTRSGEDEELEAVMKRAEDFMYRNKITVGQSSGNAVHALLATFKAKNARERAHSDRVSALCRSIGHALGLSEGEVSELEVAGLVHDIGKIAVSDAIINKEGRLTEREWSEMKRHPEFGHRILCASVEMQPIAGYVLAHHERWDGKGYPTGLAGEGIPVQARILAVADAYDAMTARRPYRKSRSAEEAARELLKCAGAQFDPQIVDVFLKYVIME